MYNSPLIEIAVLYKETPVDEAFSTISCVLARFLAPPVEVIPCWLGIRNVLILVGSDVPESRFRRIDANEADGIFLTVLESDLHCITVDNACDCNVSSFTTGNRRWNWRFGLSLRVIRICSTG